MRGLSYMNDPQTGAPRWVVFSGLDKHASYIAASRCTAVAMFACQKDYCNEELLPELPGPTDAIFPMVNAGEPTRPRVADLTEAGFPGEVPFGTQEFCGGRREPPCSSPVAEKLLRDPFLDREVTR